MKMIYSVLEEMGNTIEFNTMPSTLSENLLMLSMPGLGSDYGLGCG
jgi:hypothetical protein